MNFKDKLYAHCLNYVQERLTRTKTEIAQIQLSANAETKSSAGDKYETGRAIAQLEVARHTQQLMEAEKLWGTLREIEHVKAIDFIKPGSLVHTSQGIFYIAISLGRIEVEGKIYLIVSPQSPIGKLLLGKHVGDSVAWNEKDYKIEMIG